MMAEEQLVTEIAKRGGQCGLASRNRSLTQTFRCWISSGLIATAASARLASNMAAVSTMARQSGFHVLSN